MYHNIVHLDRYPNGITHSKLGGTEINPPVKSRLAKSIQQSLGCNDLDKGFLKVYPYQTWASIHTHTIQSFSTILTINSPLISSG